MLPEKLKVKQPFQWQRLRWKRALKPLMRPMRCPLMAIAILGWPVNVLAPEVAREVIRGGRAVCDEAGIPLAGGREHGDPVWGGPTGGPATRGAHAWPASTSAAKR